MGISNKLKIGNLYANAAIVKTTNLKRKDKPWVENSAKKQVIEPLSVESFLHFTSFMGSIIRHLTYHWDYA